jgi:hypothetical protein
MVVAMGNGEICGCFLAAPLECASGGNPLASSPRRLIRSPRLQSPPSARAMSLRSSMTAAGNAPERSQPFCNGLSACAL